MTAQQPAGEQTEGLSLHRVLVIAPHPDDDVLAAGGLIQRARAIGGDVRVVFLTSGENNAWAQRAMLRKWTISEGDRAAWSDVRMAEAADALSRLGVQRDRVEHLGLRDGGLATLARIGDAGASRAIERRVREFAPTLTIVPSMFDVHGDHRAAALYSHHAIRDACPIVTYVVHGSAPRERRRLVLALSEEERGLKLHAIDAHRTQLLIGRGRYRGHAGGDEVFYRDEYDLVCVDTATRERYYRFRHSLHAIATTAAGAARWRKGE